MIRILQISILLLFMSCNVDTIDPVYPQEGTTYEKWTFDLDLCTIELLEDGRYRITKPFNDVFPVMCNIETVTTLLWCPDKDKIYHSTRVSAPPGSLVTWYYRGEIMKVETL